MKTMKISMNALTVTIETAEDIKCTVTSSVTNCSSTLFIEKISNSAGSTEYMGSTSSSNNQLLTPGPFAIENVQVTDNTNLSSIERETNQSETFASSDLIKPKGKSSYEGSQYLRQLSVTMTNRMMSEISSMLNQKPLRKNVACGQGDPDAVVADTTKEINDMFDKLLEKKVVQDTGVESIDMLQQNKSQKIDREASEPAVVVDSKSIVKDQKQHTQKNNKNHCGLSTDQVDGKTICELFDPLVNAELNGSKHSTCSTIGLNEMSFEKYLSSNADKLKETGVNTWNVADDQNSDEDTSETSVITCEHGAETNSQLDEIYRNAPKLKSSYSEYVRQDTIDELEKKSKNISIYQRILNKHKYEPQVMYVQDPITKEYVRTVQMPAHFRDALDNKIKSDENRTQLRLARAKAKTLRKLIALNRSIEEINKASETRRHAGNRHSRKVRHDNKSRKETPREDMHQQMCKSEMLPDRYENVQQKPILRKLSANELSRNFDFRSVDEHNDTYSSRLSDDRHVADYVSDCDSLDEDNRGEVLPFDEEFVDDSSYKSAKINNSSTEVNKMFQGMHQADVYRSKSDIHMTISQISTPDSMNSSITSRQQITLNSSSMRSSYADERTVPNRDATYPNFYQDCYDPRCPDARCDVTRTSVGRQFIQ